MSATITQSTSKRLEGVSLTESLNQCLIDARAAVKCPHASLSTGAAAHQGATPAMTQDRAVSLITDFQTQTSILPFEILRALAILLGKERIETALSKSRPNLAFTPPPPIVPETPEQLKWKQRMQRLALQQEERSYSKLTNNLGKAVEDDVTIRSMTYAASIGLNMIVAPISFGVFMYFFAGGIIVYVWKRPEESPLAASTVDNRKVICAVVSGVFMLIVEMLLFVIRTHEMDKAMRKKTKTKPSKPFGPYSSASLKSFKGE